MSRIKISDSCEEFQRLAWSVAEKNCTSLSKKCFMVVFPLLNDANLLGFTLGPKSSLFIVAAQQKGLSRVPIATLALHAANIRPVTLVNPDAEVERAQEVYWQRVMANSSRCHPAFTPLGEASTPFVLTRPYELPAPPVQAPRDVVDYDAHAGSDRLYHIDRDCLSALAGGRQAATTLKDEDFRQRHGARHGQSPEEDGIHAWPG